MYRDKAFVTEVAIHVHYTSHKRQWPNDCGIFVEANLTVDQSLIEQQRNHLALRTKHGQNHNRCQRVSTIFDAMESAKRCRTFSSHVGFARNIGAGCHGRNRVGYFGSR
eukprot:PhF_6_TR43014/c0_g2_i1/m.65742